MGDNRGQPSTPQVGSMSVDTLGLGREAFRRHAWSEALEAFAAAGRTADLAPEDLELEGEAAWWLGDPDTATDALERAFAAHLDAGQTVAAARVALLLTYLSFRRLAGSIGASWQARAERLLETEPESGVHAWLEITRAAGAHAQSRSGRSCGAHRPRDRDRERAPGSRRSRPGAQLQGFAPDRLGQLAGRSGLDRRGGRSRVVRQGRRALGERYLLQHHRRLPGRERLSPGSAMDR